MKLTLHIWRQADTTSSGEMRTYQAEASPDMSFLEMLDVLNEELIEKGEINEIKEALEKSMSPGSQTFEQALFKLFMDGKITQDEAMANADSATNMLWLINQATAGEITGQSMPQSAAKPAGGAEEKKEGTLA
mgnify:CR=1 FL=1